jgi:ureidoglycolate hydrolase
LSKFDLLKELNRHITINHVEDSLFKQYGKVIDSYDFEELKPYMEQTIIPVDGNEYVASVAEMEQTKVKEEIQLNFYGGMPIQIGYCNGPNRTLNGLEYHKSSEINVMMTDLVLLLGKVQDIVNNHYDAKNVDAFFFPKGTAVELYATTLHFAPCKVDDQGFKVVVILPAGTNEPLEKAVEKKSEEDELLFMKNKWLLAHPEREVLINRGAYPGIRGENIQIFHVINETF